jgi:hypothetical protein
MPYFNDLNIYTDSFYRSSKYVIELWNKIESDILYCLGVSNDTALSIHSDSNLLIYTCLTDTGLTSTKKKHINMLHSICNFIEFTIYIAIDIKSNDHFSIKYKKCDYFFEKNNQSDEGIVEFDCEVLCSIKSYQELKTSLLISLARELQFSIYRNSFSYDINNDMRVFIATEFELIMFFCFLKGCEFKKGVSYFLKNKYIDKKNSEKILDLNKLIFNV